MKKTLEALSSLRNYLTQNLKNINTGKSPKFVFISLIGGIALAVLSAVLAPKSIIGNMGIGLGAIIAIMNGIQLIYKKYI